MGSRVLDSLYISGYGAAAASGTVQFYQPGTLVGVTVYSDDALTQALTQPITLDATGKTPLPVYTASPLRAIIKSQAGATLQDITRIDGDRAELVQVANASWPGSSTLDGVLTSLGSSFGGTNGQYLDSGAGAVPRNISGKFSEVQISVKDYGAVGNGIADDTVAIQAAVTRIVAMGGGEIYLPAGNYLVSSAITCTSKNVIFRGAAVGNIPVTAGTTVTNSNASGNAFTLSGAGSTYAFRNIKIAHATSSSGIGISASAALLLDTVLVTGHLTGISSTSSTYAVNTTASSSAAGTGMSAGGNVLVIGGEYDGGTATTGTGMSLTSGAVSALYGVTFAAGAIGLDVSDLGSTFASGCRVPNGAGPVLGLRTPSSSNSTILFHQGCDWGSVSDRRTGGPVAYSLSTSSAVTPLPMQTETVRVVATAAITVTVNAITATGFGRRWTLMCLNSSGGAVTWTFNAQYKLSAAVAPATGNMVSLILEYDPISSIVREVGRAATAI